MEGLFNGQGDLADNLRMLKRIGAKYIGRSLCLWNGEANFLHNLERAKQQVAPTDFQFNRTLDAVSAMAASGRFLAIA